MSRKHAKPARNDSKTARVIDLAERRRPGFAGHPTIGRLVSWSEEAGAVVDFPDCPGGPRPALSTVSQRELRSRVARRQDTQVLLAFADGELSAPVIVGLLRAPEEADAEDAEAESLDLDVDGKTLKIRATERIELRCGKASVILTADGKVLTRGTLLSSESEGVYRLRGGTVEIN